MNTRQIAAIIVISMLSGLTGAWLYTRNKEVQNNSSLYATAAGTENVKLSSTVSRNLSTSNVPSFVEASKASTPSVVFIRTESQYQRRSALGWFFDFDPFGSIGKVNSSGSGVILSANGYIVTNHHVIQGADKIEVVLSGQKKSFPATVIGNDPSSDLALIKIEANDLPAIEAANSDDIFIGDWVLAVGNPFNLTSTVTAGIVSAKGRNINIVNNRFPIESFIQTDAAINPGNSGGALVNLNGQLVGVNTAIASETGSYVGYGFAIPSNIVMKIVKDLREFGQVQRGFTGIEVQDIEGAIAERLSEVDRGVYVAKILQGYPEADEFQISDVIQKIDEQPINSKADYDEKLAYYRPGDRLKFTLLRDGKIIEREITLLNMEGSTELIKRVSVSSEILGADFEKISKLEKDLYRLGFGVKVLNIRKGLIKNMNLPEGFIFTSVNGKRFSNLDEFVNYLEKVKGGLRVEGVKPDGGRIVYNFNVY